LIKNTGVLHLLSAILCVFLLSTNCGTGGEKKEDAGAMLQKARDLVRVRQYQSAIEVLERAIVVDPGSFEIHREYIKLITRKGDDGAVKVYETLVRDHPSDPLYRLCLSLAEENSDKKEALVNEALELDPVYYWAVVEKARLLRNGGDHQGSIELLQNIVGTMVGVADGAFLLAQVLEEADRPDEAATVLEKLRSAHDDEKIRNRASGKLFSLKWEQESREEAQKLASELLETVNDPFLLVDIAYTMSETENYEVNSIDFFEKAISTSDTVNMRTIYPEATAGWLQNRSSKNSGFFGEGLGKVYCDLGRFEEAVPVLEKAKYDLADPYSEVLLYLANAYEGTDRTEEAIAVLLDLLSRQTHDEAQTLLTELYSGVHGDSEGLEARIEEARKVFSRKAPDFKLSDTDGGEFSLDSLKGNVVLLAFWFPT